MLIYFLVLLGTLIAAVIIAWWSMMWMPGKSFRGVPSPLDERESSIRTRLQQDLRMLAEVIGERNVSHCYDQLSEAARFIEQSLQEVGYTARRAEFMVDGKTVWNIDAECTGRRCPEEIVVVGAHYDTVPGSPGANDNGSAVIANLELARRFAELEPDRTVRFAFFANEELPYYMTDAMGSLRYAQDCQAKAENIVGMISLETIGYYLQEPMSQRYPVKLLNYLLPTTGDFVAVVGNLQSRRLVHRIIRGMRRVPFPSEGMAAPRWLKDIFRSDNAAFWRCGFQAVMITDTANFRYPYYHTPKDTAEKINYDALARLVVGLERGLLELVH